VVADSFYLASQKVREWTKGDLRKLYYPLLYVFFALAVVLSIGALGYGLAQPYVVVALNSVLGLAALFIAYPLQILVSYKFFPKELRPHPITTFILAAGAVWYAVFIIGLLAQVLLGIRL